MTTGSALDAARQVADAVLLEGYVLYPYRASAQKNQLRWQFGVLAPRGADSGEPSFAQTECLVDPGEHPVLDVTVRFLQVQQRVGEVPWDEGVVREVHATAALERLDVDHGIPFDIPGGEDTRGDAGEGAGGTAAAGAGGTRCRQPLSGVIVIRAHRLDGPYGAVKVRVRVENRTAWDPAGASREEMLRRSLVSTHTLLAVRDAAFLSLLDPPRWAAHAAASCDNQHTWPVLIGEGRTDVMLSSPIILYDYPQIAPESPTDLCDATEIDELLMLRTMTLTDEEKAEAKITDPRAASIIDRADSMPPELMDRLHGAVRYLRDVTSGAGRPDPGHPDPVVPPQGFAVPATPDPYGAHRHREDDAPPWWDPGQDASVSPETDSIPIPGGRASRGTQVRLHPGAVEGGASGPRRRTDAQDMFLEGRVATVAAVFFDVDGGSHLAVTVNDDPAAELHGQHGRYLYFTPGEVEHVAEAVDAGDGDAGDAGSEIGSTRHEER